MNFTFPLGRNIIPLFGQHNKQLFSEINEVEAYWYGLRSGRVVPLRSEIDPRGIERALSYTFILERIAPGLARFRLAGTHLNELMGMDVRGMPFTSLFTPAARSTIMQRLEGVFDGPEVAELALFAEKGIGRPPMSAKVILLPLRSDLGEISRVMGCFIADGKLGRAPRRFDVEGEVVTALQSDKDQSQVSQPAPPETPFVAKDDPEPMLNRQRPMGTDQPNLRLVVTNE